MRRVLVLCLSLGVLGVLVALGALGAPAAAHDDQGVLVGEYLADSPPDSPDGTYRARLTYSSDGHPAEGATVTLTAADPAGGAIAATPMTAVDAGEYEAALTFPNPGAWSVTVVATNPAATFEQAVTISEPEPATTTSTTEVETEAIAGAGGDGGGSSTGLVIGIVVAVVAVAAATAVALVVRRRRMAA